MPRVQIVQRKTGVGHFLAAIAHDIRDSVSRAQPRGAFLQRPEQNRRSRAMFGREIDIARRHREPVALALDRRTDDLDPQVEVAGHLGHHFELLIVFFTEDREVGPGLGEQLADHGRDPAEKMRPDPIFKAGRRRPFRSKPCREAIGIHDPGRRVPDQIHTFGGEFRDIFLPRPGI